MKPVRLPAAATIALPRWSIVILCLLYILPGLIGRDPWKSVDDAAGFGIMWTMAHGNLNDWLWPHVVGLPMADEGPLAFWLGAICIKLFGWLCGDPMAARIATGAAFLIGALSVWYSTYLLGRRQEAQPLKLPFGGQPEPRDFGKTLADGALLIYLASFGLLIPSHTTTTGPLYISLIACAMYFAVRLFDTPQKRTAIKFGAILGLLILTRGWILPIALLTVMVLLSLYRQQKLHFSLIGLSLPTAAIIVGTWIVTILTVLPYSSSPYQAWMTWNYHQVSLPSIDILTHFFRNVIWFAWPAWPFAAWSIYAWRKQESTLHISLPVSFLVPVLVFSLLNPNRDAIHLLPLLPPLAMLAAFGLPTMKRSAINAVDWFAVMVLTGVAIIFWFGWSALQTGWPSRTSAKVLSWAPGFVPEFGIITFVLAMAVTVVWFRIVYWRISRQPSVLWRAVVLSSGGVIFCWFLIMSLGLPLFNHRMSYANVAKEMTSKISAPYRCIDSKLGAAQRASFAYFGNVHFASFNEQDCELLLTQSNRQAKGKRLQEVDKDFPGTWEKIWEGQRSADKDEFFTLYRKK